MRISGLISNYSQECEALCCQPVYKQANKHHAYSNIRMYRQETHMEGQTTDKPVGAKSKLLYRYITSRALKYYDVHSLPLIRYYIWNNTSKPISFFVETVIEGYTFGVEHLGEVQAKSSIYHYHLPISDIRNMASLTDDIPAAVYARL